MFSFTFIMNVIIRSVLFLKYNQALNIFYIFFQTMDENGIAAYVVGIHFCKKNITSNAICIRRQF